MKYVAGRTGLWSPRRKSVSKKRQKRNNEESNASKVRASQRYQMWSSRERLGAGDAN
jgi:hypothetical protein